MIANIDKFSLRITPRDGGSYKSISNLLWNDIPGFAILTGKNGSGKTQFLEILAYHFSGALPNNLSIMPINVNITGINYQAHEIGYVPSSGRFSGGGPSSLAHFPNIRQQALQHARQIHHYRNDIWGMTRARRFQKLFDGKDLHGIDDHSLEKLLPDDFEFAIDDIDITSGITHVFMAYRFKKLEGLERGFPDCDRDGNPLGPAPWSVVNDSLKIAGFPYEVITPENTPITGSYDLRLKDLRNDNQIYANDLSSGEKVLLQLVLWLFSASKDGIFPRLLLLDEPDAHLHPSMTTQFMDIISEVLVKKYGVRVIMTTHSPSTVALAPPESIFQIERGSSSINRVESRSEMISILTSGLITVSKTTKFCFVEDNSDVDFYQTVYDIITDYGPSRDRLALDLTPSIAFIAASIGSGIEKIPGGSTVVAKWVSKLDAEPLDRTFFGIIDCDKSNHPSARVHVIGRYSIENYLLDPINLFALLLEEGSAPSIPGINISSGDEHLLRLKPASELQAIVDVVCHSMVAAEPRLVSAQTVPVAYSAGVTVQAPKWVIEHRGHDLLPIAQRAFGSPKVVNPVRLLKALRRCRLIPTELVSVLRAVQTA